MSKVWADQTITDHQDLIVLLAIADYANDDGVAWPSIDSIAQKSRFSRRSVFYVLDRLKKADKLSIKTGGGRASSTYKIKTYQPCKDCTPPVQGLHGTRASTCTAPVQNGIAVLHPIRKESSVEPKKRKDKIASLSPSAVFDEWNSKANQLPKCRQLSDKRSHSLKARLRDPFFCEHWISAITRIHDSSFCCGSNNRGWKADFDWFIQPDTVVRIMEGKYDNNNPVAGVKSSLTAQIARDVLR